MKMKVKRKRIDRVGEGSPLNSAEMSILQQKSSELPSENVVKKFFCAIIVEDLARPDGAWNLSEATKPCALLPRKSPRVLLCVLDGIVEPPKSAQVHGEFSVANRLRGLCPEWGASEERADFIQESCLHHVNDPRIDVARIRGTVGEQPDASPAIGKRRGRSLPLLLELRKRATRERVHFERADQASNIVSVDSSGCHGIDSLQLCMERVSFQRLQTRAEFHVSGWTLEQTRQQRLHIEVGSANDDGSRSASGERIEQLACGVQPVLDREARCMRVCDVEEMMWDLRAECAGWLCRADIHPAVDLHGVGADDLGTRHAARGSHRQCALAARGRSDDEEDPWGTHASWLYPPCHGTLTD